MPPNLTSPYPTARSGILWHQVLGLGALQGTITLAWLVYNLYLTKLLTQAGLPAAWSIAILLAENLLSVVLEPWMGSWSDRRRRWFGLEFPVLPIGAALAGLIFAALPVIAAMGAQSPPWLLPIGLITWAVAMALFRSPALGLLRHMAPVDQLPQASSVLTLCGSLVGWGGLYVQPWILAQGPTFAFALGSGVLLAAAVGLRGLDRRSATIAQQFEAKGVATEPVTANRAANIPPIGYAWLLLLGLSSGLGNSGLRSWLNAMSPDKGLTSVLVLFTVTHIITILPAGKIATSLGNRVTTGFGLGLATVGLAGLWLTGPLLGSPIAILLGLAASCVVNGLLPFVLACMPADRAGLGVGLFFGGAALAGSLLSLLTRSLNPVPVAVSLGVGVIGFVITGVCVMATPRHLGALDRA